MGLLLTEQIKQVYRKNVRNLKKDFTRNPIRIFWVEEESFCPNCKYDSIRKTSTNVVAAGGINFSGICPVCQGKGKLRNSGSVEIYGTVHYPGQDNQNAYAEAGGTFNHNQCELSVLKEQSFCQSGVFSGKKYFDFWIPF